jgi:pyruvate-ferredoxin/flavodoxin oxidoreductase
MTVSHLRFGPEPIRSTYLVQEADLVACHQFGLLDRFDVLGNVCRGGTFLLNAPYPADELWTHLPAGVRHRIVERELRVFTIDATRIARELGMSGRINTVMQPCFFALTDLLPTDRAIAAVKDSIKQAYGRRGRLVVERNEAAVDRALTELAEVDVHRSVGATDDAVVSDGEGASATLDALASAHDVARSDFVERVTMRMIAGEGDQLPVSAMPVDGTFPTGTTSYEKRKLALEIPVWEPDLCIDCG